MVVGALTTITSQWLPNWNCGMSRLQRNEHVALGLERLTADIAAAEFLSSGRDNRKPFFDGENRSVIFVRTALGPNAGSGLEIVRIAEVSTARGSTVVRTRAPFLPQPGPINDLQHRVTFSDPVVLLRAPYLLSLSYAGADRIWQPVWRQQTQLPKAVKLSLRDAVTHNALSVSTAVLVHSELPADCIEAKSFADCLATLRSSAQAEKAHL